MQRFELAIESVQSWLKTLRQISNERSWLTDECALLISLIARHEDEATFLNGQKSVDFVELIDASRDEIMMLSLSLSEHKLCASSDSALAAVYLAESFARSDDLQAVAVMLELCERLVVDHASLAQLWEFVLNQQGSDGSFGLISAELSMLGRGDDQVVAKLTLTRDVLRAIRARNQSVRKVNVP